MACKIPVREGGSNSPHWPEKYAKLHVFSAFDAYFCSKNDPPLKGFRSRSCEGVAVSRPEEAFEFVNSAEKSVSL